jgi:5-(carboxyamino)imidazole ribonucleotide synthase
MKTPRLKIPVRFGIFGAGQLARMMVLEGAPLGLEMHVYSENALDPAGQVTGFHHSGSLTDGRALEAFLAKVDIATFESEFMNADLLKAASAKTRVPIYPEPGLMGSLQDRLTQKKLLDQHKIPTAPWMPVAKAQEFESAATTFKAGLVLKKRRFGYDGKGTFVFQSKDLARSVIYPLSEDPYGAIAEPLIGFRRELATLLFRNSGGDIVVYPLVETHQEESRCLWVKGPVSHPSWPALQKKLRHFVEAIQLQGTLAFELFDCKGELLVNEVAPRVHNSGHYSQDAMSCSQFEMHLRCGLNAELPAPSLQGAFAMWNLIGSGRQPQRMIWPKTGHLHLYGKTENSRGRKMGHINVVAKTPSQALARVRKLRKDIEI